MGAELPSNNVKVSAQGMLYVLLIGAVGQVLCRDDEDMSVCKIRVWSLLSANGVHLSSKKGQIHATE